MRVHSREEIDLGPKEISKATNGNNKSKGLLHQQGNKEKGGMDADVFDMISQNHVEAVLKGASKMLKILYTKQGSGFCGVGY